MKKSISKKIKSNVIFKLIMFHLEKSKYLDVIKYNKQIQKKIELSLEDYKKESNRMLILEKNGHGKEYKLYSDILLFEGEYKNRRRNGRGKEYDENGKLKFEGEFFNGKIIEGTGYDDKGIINLRLEKNGKGEEYYDNGNIKFEGEYLNGKRWNGKGYSPKRQIIYELKNGKGKVKEYNNQNELLFYGEYINGKRNGKGKEYYSSYYNRIKFEGEYFNGKKWNGKGYNPSGEKVYTIKNGKGYIKEYKNGILILEGEYSNGEINGRGKEYNSEGTLIFKGIYLNTLKNGFGEEYYELHKIKFEGEYKHGKRNGKGKEYQKGNIVFEGEYINNKRNGKGREYNEKGRLIFEGNYYNDKTIES